MKTFSQFNKDVNEAAVALKALPYAAKAFTKVAPMVAPKIANFASGALKFGTAIPVGLGIANVLQSRGDGESNFDKLRKMREKGKGEDLRKKSEKDAEKPSTREKIKNALVDASLNYRKGLSAGLDVEKTSSTGPIGSASDEFRKREGGESPAKVVRDLLRKQKENIKAKRKENKEIDDKLGK